MVLFAAATVLLAVLLLVAEARGSRAGIWVAKPLASAGFVATAIADGASETPYGRLVLIALVFGWLGDVLLIPRSRAVFAGGIASFLLGHLAFAAAFLLRGADLGWTAACALALAVPAVATWRWLRAHVPASLKLAVIAYVIVISAMLACAVGTAARASAPLLLLGATMFFVSDLAVARNRFVAPGFANKLWGLPLYYGGQLLLAASAASTGVSAT